MTTVEFGVRYEWANGVTFDSGPCSRAFAELAVKSQRSNKAAWNPRAVAVITRDVQPWQPVAESSVVAS